MGELDSSDIDSAPNSPVVSYEATPDVVPDEGSTASASSPSKGFGRRPFRKFQKRKRRVLKPDDHVIINKKILVDHFWPGQGKLPLPDDWIYTRHVSGTFVYMHQPTRVVTLAPPYVLEKNLTLRRHRVPIYAIPCYMYRYVQQREQETKAACPQRLVEDKDEPVPDEEAALMEPTCKPAAIDNDDDLASLFASDEPPIKRERTEEEEVTAQEGDNAAIDTIKEPTVPANAAPIIPSATAITTNDTLTPDQLRRYFQNAFEYKDVEIHRFGSVAARNEYYRERKRGSSATVTKPALSDTDVIRFQVPNGPNVKGDRMYKDCAIKIANKTYLAILHEYSMAFCKSSPTFKFVEQVVNELNPFRCEVYINDMIYGTGEGATKKISKAVSARAALHNLIRDFHKVEPQIKDYESLKQLSQFMDSQVSVDMDANKQKHVESQCPFATHSATQLSGDAPTNEDEMEASQVGEESNCLNSTSMALDMSLSDAHSEDSKEGVSAVEVSSKWDEDFFEKLEITNPLSFQHLNRAGLPQPKALLLECLKRNFIPASELKEESFNVRGRKGKRRVIMRLRHFSTEVDCSRNKDGRQIACQNLLAQMYPTLRHWGPILRLFGPGSLPESKMDLTEIQKLQMREKGSVKLSLISMLKAKMLQLGEQWESMPEYGKGKFGLFNGPIPTIILHPDAQAMEAQLNTSISNE